MAPAISKMLGREIVHIKVGKEKQDFGVHKKLISHYSPYFKAAFNSGFQDTETGIMTLPETEPKVFELFYEWLYTQKLWNKDVKKEDWPRTYDLVKLYIFSDMARVPSLQNQTLKALHDISNLTNEFPYGHMDFIWKNTSSRSPLRRYFLDQLMWYCEPKLSTKMQMSSRMKQDWISSKP